jgi:hypothetical protein
MELQADRAGQNMEQNSRQDTVQDSAQSTIRTAVQKNRFSLSLFVLFFFLTVVASLLLGIALIQRLTVSTP